MLVVAALVDNVRRRYPVYWWTPLPLGPVEEEVKKDVESSPDAEKPSSRSSDRSSSTLGGDDETALMENKVVVLASGLSIPGWLREELGEESLEILEVIQSRLAEVERGEATVELKKLRSRSRSRSRSRATEGAGQSKIGD